MNVHVQVKCSEVSLDKAAWQTHMRYKELGIEEPKLYCEQKEVKTAKESEKPPCTAFAILPQFCFNK